MKKLSREVISVLDASLVEGHSLYLPGSPRHLPDAPRMERKLYEAVNNVLVALGGKWKGGKAQAHIFDGDVSAEIEAAIATGAVENRKQALGFFETPAPLARRLVEMAGVKNLHRLLEPSAGRGAIVHEMRAAAPKAAMYGVEIDPKHVDAAKAAGASVVLTGDFLLTNLPTYGRFDRGFDRIVANPPFAKQADVDHVRHMYELLHVGGVLVSVMAAGVTFRDNRKSVEFREFVEANGGEIEPLPDGSFAESGTNVSTCVVRIPKAA